MAGAGGRWAAVGGADTGVRNEDAATGNGNILYNAEAETG